MMPRTRKGRRATRTISAFGWSTFLVAAAALLVPVRGASVHAQAAPVGVCIVEGRARWSFPDATTTRIAQETDRLAINCDAFSIAPTEIVELLQPGSDATLLIRVTGREPTTIEGRLVANGSVLLVNPNGVVLGSGSDVQVAGFAAIATEVANGGLALRDVAPDRPGTPSASVLNAGQIEVARGGCVRLVGVTVENDGSIAAHSGEVRLVGGEQGTVAHQGPTDVCRTGQGAVVNSGTIDVSGIAPGGDGGTISISGYAIVLTGSQVMRADPFGTGAGGSVSLYAEALQLDGTISAGTPQGTPGRILLDPAVLNIDAATAALIVSWLPTAHVIGSARDAINVDAVIDSSGQVSATSLNLMDEDASPLTINLNQAITLGVNQTLTGQGTTVNVAAAALIQNGIDVSLAGATVIVHQGTYTENINFKGKAITVRSTDPADPTVVAATIIDGGAGGSVVRFSSGEGSGSVLSGFTIRNGAGESGGGVYCLGASPTITSNRITDNDVSDEGGGIYCGSSSPSITGNEIASNTAVWGGGIYCGVDSSPTIEGNVIHDNSATNYGAGVYCFGSGSPIIRGNTIAGNSTSWGAGIACVGGSSPEIRGNTIRSNAGNGDGGGIYCGGSSPVITDNTISRNTTGEGAGVVRRGGGICCRDDSAATIRRNTIRLNSAYEQGGGVFCSTGLFEISDNTITGNSASSGGGISASGASGTANHNVIAYNTASFGGGGVLFASGTYVSDGNTISRNTAASSGGGILCAYSSSVTIANSIVSSSGSGGGIYNYLGDSSVTVRFSNVYGNAGGDYVGMPDATGTNGNLSRPPLFANLAKGDFHLKSRGGRWDPAASAWVVDTVHSPCIDAGDPASAWDQEPVPNLKRANMGAYGNTAEASKSANRPPALAWVGQAPFLADGVDPDVGEPGSTEFTFRVRISDPDDRAPKRMHVRIERVEDGRELRTVATLPLQAVSGSWAGGMVCEAKRTLSNGAYRYHFYAADDAGVTATGEPSAPARGPEMNAAPQLWCSGLAGREDGFLEPDAGTAFDTRFRFAVLYTDGEGALPGVRRIEIQRKRADGTWCNHRATDMLASGGAPQGGKYYVWKHKLPAGEYRHRFVFEDDDGAATGAASHGPDATRWQNGPTVSEGTSDAVASAGTIVTSLAVLPSAGGAQVVFSLSAPMAVDARILNIAGRPVKTLCHGKDCEAGANTLLWNATSDQGLPVPNGTYLVEVMAKAGDGTRARALGQVRVNR